MSLPRGGGMHISRGGVGGGCPACLTHGNKFTRKVLNYGSELLRSCIYQDELCAYACQQP